MTRGRGPLATPGNPRDLSPEEWQALERARRAKWPQLVLTGAILLGGVGGFLIWFLVDPRNRLSAASVVFTCVFAGLFGTLGALAIASPFWPRAERPNGKPRRVGYHRGLVNVVGKPAKLTIGGIWVDVPDGWPLGLMEDVEVEIMPPLEEFANRRTQRAVVSAFGGRLRITDSATPRAGAT